MPMGHESNSVAHLFKCYVGHAIDIMCKALTMRILLDDRIIASKSHGESVMRLIYMDQDSLQYRVCITKYYAALGACHQKE